MRLHFIPIHVFRETPSVTFFDAGVPGSNGTDVVAHYGAAISPPDLDGSEQYYVHQHQVDHNLVIEGERIFTLLNPAWPQPHHVIHIVRAMGALQIPVGTYHRSVSGDAGSLVLNQSLRDPAFNYATEFIPVCLGDHHCLSWVRRSLPWVWRWNDGHICRQHERKGAQCDAIIDPILA
ncbi:hemagglutinin [Synechococcus sp. MIT S1220]|uniref:hemagglutinin n=1 Tax=Synechococcus sp. MIT S1220 TaxID=3082549 RepID=UPI0039AEF076